ncbi:MAG TPA: universal stress protein [Desulfobulbus sp.]|nr:universal stress protein [Desulfobulbus sp.]
MKTLEDTVRFLVPLDIDGSRDQSVAMMKCLVSILGDRIVKITLLHVMAGRYLSGHMANIDFRAKNVISTDKFKELRQQYIDSRIRPVLEEAKEEIRRAGTSAEIKILVEDGDPVERIVERVAREGVDALVLQRSGLSRVGDMFVGSVTSGVLHREVRCSIYLPGSRLLEQGCQPKCCLVALDESEHSAEALARAGRLASACSDTLDRIILVHVLDIARCGEALADGREVAGPAEKLLNDAVSFLVSRGVAEDRVRKVAACGDPAEVLTDVAGKEKVDVLFMGRRGRGAVKDIFMGSVSRKIIYRCPEPTIVLVSVD